MKSRLIVGMYVLISVWSGLVDASATFKDQTNIAKKIVVSKKPQNESLGVTPQGHTGKMINKEVSSQQLPADYLVVNRVSIPVLQQQTDLWTSRGDAKQCIGATPITWATFEKMEPTNSGYHALYNLMLLLIQLQDKSVNKPFFMQLHGYSGFIKTAAQFIFYQRKQSKDVTNLTASEIILLQKQMFGDDDLVKNIPLLMIEDESGVDCFFNKKHVDIVDKFRKKEIPMIGVIWNSGNISKTMTVNNHWVSFVAVNESTKNNNVILYSMDSQKEHVAHFAILEQLLLYENIKKHQQPKNYTYKQLWQDLSEVEFHCQVQHESKNNPAVCRNFAGCLVSDGPMISHFTPQMLSALDIDREEKFMYYLESLNTTWKSHLAVLNAEEISEAKVRVYGFWYNPTAKTMQTCIFSSMTSCKDLPKKYQNYWLVLDDNKVILFPPECPLYILKNYVFNKWIYCDVWPKDFQRKILEILIQCLKYRLGTGMPISAVDWVGDEQIQAAIDLILYKTSSVITPAEKDTLQRLKQKLLIV